MPFKFKPAFFEDRVTMDPLTGLELGDVTGRNSKIEALLTGSGGTSGIKDVAVGNRLIDYGNGTYEIREYRTPYTKRINTRESLLSDPPASAFGDDCTMDVGTIDSSDSLADSDNGTVARRKDDSTPYEELAAEEKAFLNEQRSIQRAKAKIKDYVMTNDFTQFWTLTFSPKKVNDRYDDADLIKKFRRWMNKIRERKCKFDYIAIPERHKDGAIHFHVLVADHTLNIIDSGKKDTAGRLIYNLTDWTYGFSTAVKTDNQRARIANYVTKYVTKHFDSAKAVEPRYICSRGLKTPTVEYNVDISQYPVEEAYVKYNKEGDPVYKIWKEK